MTVISPAAIKDLRERTGAGMLDCKKALEENKGNFEAAVDWLRKKGIAGAAKKAGRVAAEGLVAVAKSGNKAAVIELNSETDFVAKNDKFQVLANQIAQVALSNDGDYEKIKTAQLNGKSVNDLVTDAVASIGENIQFRRSTALSVKQGVVATYIHNAATDTLGKIGVLIALESSAPADKLEAFGRKLAMHVAAAKPLAVTREGVDASAIERERQIFIDQARQSGKPDNIIEKMIEGRIRKFYEEVVLPEQIFVIDGKSKVSEVVAAEEKALGAPITIANFAHFVLGEGIEKKETDFAAEVAGMAANG